MRNRFLAALGWMMLYLSAPAVMLLLVVLVAGEDMLMLLVLVLVVLTLDVIGLIPFLNWVIRRVFRLPGEGQPVSEADLRAQILAINDLDAPVMVEERGDRLVATWKYADAAWWKLLAKAGLKQVYELHIKLDGARHRATLVDINRRVFWRSGPGDVRLAGSPFRAVVMGFEIGEPWGIAETYGLSQRYDYRFVPQEIKNPILNTILQAGWEVRFGMW